MSVEFQEMLKKANAAMLGKTNRTILFTTVNMDQYLDPLAPEDELEETPSLAGILPYVGDLSEEALASRVRDQLTVTSFEEFLEKFQPGFYYRVRSSAPTESGDGENTNPDDGMGSPELEFALKGGTGWKKVTISSEHPYVLCLQNLIKTRVKKEDTTFRVNVDSALFGFKPRSQRLMMRKLAENVQVRAERMMLEAGRNPNSGDARKALAAYEDAAGEFRDACEDHIRTLPTIAYGLEETAKEIGRQSGGGAPPDPNTYAIEFGTNRRLIAAPRPVAALPGAMPTAPKALDEAAAAAQKALDGGGEGETAEATDLAKASGTAGGDLAKAGGAAAAAGAQEIAVRSIDQALDILRKQGEGLKGAELATIKKEQRFPAVVGGFLSELSDQGAIAPLVGALVATVLQDAAGLAKVNPKLEDVTHYHDVFLDMYAGAVRSFLETVTPLFETVMGVYLLFNEFPRDVRLSEDMKPQLIIANADLPDLYMTRQAELEAFFQKMCGQAANQYQDAISFAIVPNVAEFRKKRPAARRTRPAAIDVTGGITGTIRAGMTETTGGDEGYGRVTYIDEMMGLLDWGWKFGFQVLFSPEERVKSGRTTPDEILTMRDAYAISTIVDKDPGNCAIFCVPDFILMPPDGKLVVGRRYDDGKELGIDVPELVVRSCFVAAGRLMANDVPAYLRRKLQRGGKDISLGRPDLPGVGVSLSKWPILGVTELPADHFHGDFTLKNLMDSEMPFLVFTHVRGNSPFLSVPRTMKRVPRADGSNTYANLNLFRQYVYVRRLFTAANLLNLNQEMPADDEAAAAELRGDFGWILEWSGWHNDKLANSFPSRLTEGQEITFTRQEGNAFKIEIGFEEGVIGGFDVSF